MQSAVPHLAQALGLLVAIVSLMQTVAVAVPPGEQHEYRQVDGRDLRIYVTKPPSWQASDRRGAILFFHGGGWTGGAPGQFDEHAAYFASRGLVCFQAEYRLLDKQSDEPPTKCVEDAISAMRWVRANSERFGIRADRIAAAGGSAGGHLATFLGTVNHEGQSEVDYRCNLMLLFNPVYDNGPGGWGTARVKERWPEFSPAHNIGSDMPPSIVFLGTEDKLIPVETAERFRDNSLAAGVESQLFTYEGQGHGFFNFSRNQGRWFYETVLQCDRFLVKHRWLEGEPTLQPALAENIVLITLDGLRSEEVFAGADRRLMIKELGVENPQELEEELLADSPEESRTRLLPFLWEQIDQGGWIAGDIQHKSVVKVTNGRYFSYPGYNELLSGIGDHSIDSNDKKYNRNTTVLEWLHQREAYSGSVAAYCSWDVFPFIINDRRSGIPVNAGWSDLVVGDPAKVDAANFVAHHLFHQWESVRYDAFTALGAIEEIKANQPSLLYVALGETDDWAHAGRYDRYLLSARQNDQFIRQIWETLGQYEKYRGKTAMVITTDHGRGDGREGWKNHSDKLPGSEFIWVAAFGAGVSARGIDQGGSFTQAQVAATVAALLGHDFAELDGRIAKPLPIVGACSLVAPEAQ